MSTKTTQQDGGLEVGCRLTIEAVGLRKSDAAAYALSLIGQMMQDAHELGHSCSGYSGNAFGKWQSVKEGDVRR
jgi:hypothetical protein